MNRSSFRRGAAAATLGAALLLPGTTTSAAPPAPGQSLAGRQAQATGAERATAASHVVEGRGAVAPERGPERAYPRQQVLHEPEVDLADASIRLGLIPFHEIAPRLNELQAASDRVSVEVLGESAQGRELYMVTVTSPETTSQAMQQERLKYRIQEDPARAARDPHLASRYKAPVFVNSNIHGDEWEGTDAALRIIEDLATSEDPGVDALLDRTRLHFVVTMNPDGRVGNTRANANGFDMNRDFITASQAEVRAVRAALIETQPLVMLDLHGYVNGTLIEPTTPPHGENYEYDLFIEHAYPNGLAMEAAVNALGYTLEDDGVEPVQIPFRDDEQGWDDWPPIFTPQYAAFHGAVSHTIEIPLRVNRSSYELPVEELRRRTAINTDIAEAAIRAAIAYTDANRVDLIANQIEMFRRGEAGEPQRPVTSQMFPEIGPEDVYTTEFPEAYVIPVGEGQRSAVAAARLVDHLVANDVEVMRADRPLTVGDRTYAAGSYVVDMHQAKRGMANVILAAGRDISADFDVMYDISGWSLGLLWGATVDAVTSERPDVVGEQVDAAVATGSVPAGAVSYELALLDPNDVAALNRLLAEGAEVRWTADGTAWLPHSEADLVRAAASELGVMFAVSDEVDPQQLEALEPLTVAAAVPDAAIWALHHEMGFDVAPVSTEILNEGFDWTGVDALMVSAGLDTEDLDADAAAALEAWVADGGVVTRGGTGTSFNADLDLLTLTGVEGNDDANGVVAVDNLGGPIATGAPAHSFVYSPYWFTELGAEVAVEQRYATEGPLVSGHWTATEEGDGGQAAAAGQASVVRGIDESGTAVVMFGTEPLFRAHPKGVYGQVGRALFWTAVTAD